MSYAILNEPPNTKIVYDLGVGFRVYFLKKLHKKYTTQIAYKNAYFPSSHFEYEMHLKHWLDSFTRQMMRKGESYKIGQFLSFAAVQKDQVPYLQCTITVNEGSEQGEYDIYLDRAECYVVARSIQHLYGAARAYLHLPWE